MDLEEGLLDTNSTKQEIVIKAELNLNSPVPIHNKGKNKIKNELIIEDEDDPSAVKPLSDNNSDKIITNNVNISKADTKNVNETSFIPDLIQLTDEDKQETEKNITTNDKVVIKGDKNNDGIKKSPKLRTRTDSLESVQGNFIDDLIAAIYLPTHPALYYDDEDIIQETLHYVPVDDLLSIEELQYGYQEYRYRNRNVDDGQMDLTNSDAKLHIDEFLLPISQTNGHDKNKGIFSTNFIRNMFKSTAKEERSKSHVITISQSDEEEMDEIVINNDSDAEKGRCMFLSNFDGPNYNTVLLILLHLFFLFYFILIPFISSFTGSS